MPRRNEDVAQLLSDIGELLALRGENPFRVRAYEEAARSIDAMSDDVEAVWRSGRLDDIPHIGPALAGKIDEYLRTGRSSYYDGLRRQSPTAPIELLKVPSIGPARAKLIHDRLGISRIEQLERAASEHRLRSLPGIGEKLEAKLAREAARATERGRRMLLGIALPTAEDVASALRSVPGVLAADPAGSIRRRQATIGDIDILVASDEPREVLKSFTSLPLVKEVLAVGPTRGSILTLGNLQVDIRAIRPDSYGAALMYFTGSKEHNIALRELAQRRSWKLSEYGLFDESDQLIAGRTEAEVYAALGLQWIPPELRESRGEIAASAHRGLPTLVEVNDIKGDLHVHTRFSDGHDPIEQLVEAALGRGYQYLAVTDHSRSLIVAGGLSVEDVARVRGVVDDLNTRYAPFRILHGTEVDILPDGTLDYPDEVLAHFDIVTAAVHGSFEQPRERMTERVISALRNPHVTILCHPTGRLLTRRSSYDVDIERVIHVATECGVALEIDGQPDRLDLDDAWSKYAKSAGALIACNSDAHSVRQLDYMYYAVATARRGWLESGDILNTAPLDQLLQRLELRRSISAQ